MNERVKSVNFYDDYAAQAKQYAIFPIDRSLEYTTLGLAGELGEFIECLLEDTDSFPGTPEEASSRAGGILEHLADEAGDVWWYAAALADALEEPFSRIVSNPDLPNYRPDANTLASLACQLGIIAGAVKKSIRDDNGALTLDRKVKIIMALRQLCYDLICFDWIGGGHKAVMTRNLNKLESRKQRNVIAGDGDNR
jgi:NTP pyrophosphatase (non-canonical NTP hydrolase)